MRKGKTALSFTRKELLKRARFHLDQVRQWVDMEHYHNAAKYSAAAEAVIEILEIGDCGSVGGFDVGQIRNGSLEARYEWLKGKQ